MHRHPYEGDSTLPELARLKVGNAMKAPPVGTRNTIPPAFHTFIVSEAKGLTSPLASATVDLIPVPPTPPLWRMLLRSAEASKTRPRGARSEAAPSNEWAGRVRGARRVLRARRLRRHLLRGHGGRVLRPVVSSDLSDSRWLFTVKYEDDDCEDLELEELKAIIQPADPPNHVHQQDKRVEKASETLRRCPGEPPRW